MRQNARQPIQNILRVGQDSLRRFRMGHNRTSLVTWYSNTFLDSKRLGKGQRRYNGHFIIFGAEDPEWMNWAERLTRIGKEQKTTSYNTCLIHGSFHGGKVYNNVRSQEIKKIGTVARVYVRKVVSTVRELLQEEDVENIRPTLEFSQDQPRETAETDRNSQPINRGISGSGCNWKIDITPLWIRSFPSRNNLAYFFTVIVCQLIQTLQPRQRRW